MKGRILSILREDTAVVSGETISTRLGVSRVSVWKHIRKLKEIGYHIHTTAKGYRLKNSPDVLYPWEFAGRESTIHYFDQVTSTMDIARDLARNHCPDFTVVIAGSQTQGRGRLERVWHSAAGGLYFTLVLRPQLPPAFSYRVYFAASTIMTQTLRDLYNIDARVKWPNDILVNGWKISGMLSEMEAEADLITYINIGLGLNVNNAPPPDEPTASSLKEILGSAVPRKEILAHFLDEFEARLDQGNLDQVMSEWKQYSATLNRPVKIVTTRDESDGIAVDVDENGALILKLADGSIKKIIYGDCFHDPAGSNAEG
jgi:BirA family biotin operon repressor/biotin-[acetyl-CoA-carboxylase] ligase